MESILRTDKFQHPPVLWFFFNSLINTFENISIITGFLANFIWIRILQIFLSNSDVGRRLFIGQNVTLWNDSSTCAVAKYTEHCVTRPKLGKIYFRMRTQVDISKARTKMKIIQYHCHIPCSTFPFDFFFTLATCSMNIQAFQCENGFQLRTLINWCSLFRFSIKLDKCLKISLTTL